MGITINTWLSDIIETEVTAPSAKDNKLKKIDISRNFSNFGFTDIVFMLNSLFAALTTCKERVLKNNLASSKSASFLTQKELKRCQQTYSLQSPVLLQCYFINGSIKKTPPSLP